MNLNEASLRLMRLKYDIPEDAGMGLPIDHKHVDWLILH